MHYMTMPLAMLMTVALVAEPATRLDPTALGQAAEPLLAPTEVLHRVHDALAAGDRTKQGDIVRGLLPLARKTGLSVEEEMALAEIYFLALNPRDSNAIFEKHLDRSDKIGRMAWIRHQQIQFRAFDKHAETEAALDEFRKRFAVSPDDLTYTSSMVANQANRHATAGDHAKAAQLVLDDVSRLPLDVPLRNFRLLGSFFGSMQKAGRAAEARALLESHRSKLQERIARHGAGLAGASTLRSSKIAHQPGRLHADWDIQNADDEAGFDPQRYLTQAAIDRIRELDAMLQGKPPSP